MNARKTLLALLAAVPAVLTSSLAAAGPWLLKPGEHYNEFTGGFTSSNVFYDDLGQKQRFGFQTVFEERSLISYNELGWKNRVSVAFAVPVRNRTITSETFRASLTQTGIADLMFGFRLKLKDGATALALEADWIGPAGYDRDAVPALGSGQQNVVGALDLGLPILSSGFFQASGAYQHRFDAPPDEIDPTADLGWWLTSSLLLSGHYAAEITVNEKKGSPKASLQSAGPELRYRLDDRMDVFAGSAHAFAGRNANHFNRYYAGIAFKQTHLNRLQGFLGGKRRP
jgi:hypothetical protein